MLRNARLSLPNSQGIFCCHSLHVLCLRLGLLTVLLFTFAAANAEVYSIRNSGEVIQLEPFLEYLPGHENGRLSLEEVSKKAFVPRSGFSGKTVSHQPYWLKIQLRNDLPNGAEKVEWVLHFSLIPTAISYFATNDNAPLQTGKSGYFLPVSERSFKPVLKGNLGKLLLPPGQVVTLFIKMESSRQGMGPDFKVNLSHTDTFYSQLKTRKQWNGLFVGFMVLMLIYNLFLFMLAKDRAFLYYSTYLFGLIFFTVYNTGDLADWLYKFAMAENPEHIQYLKTSVYLTIIANLGFLRYFLDLRNLLPKWDRACQWLMIGAVLFFVMDVVTMVNTNFNYDSADVFTVGFSAIFLVLIFSLPFPLSKTSDKKRYFVIGGILAMGLGILSVIIFRLQTVDFSTLLFRAGIMVEVIFFSLGLAYRQMESDREKQQAAFALERSQLLRVQQEKEAKRLEDLDDAKNKLYTNIAHELRTPLTVIMGMTEELATNSQQLAVSEQEKDMMEKELNLIKRNSHSLLQHVNQLLDLSKLDAGMLKLNNEQGDIINYLTYLTESFHTMAQEKNLRLTFYSEISELVMDFDAEKMQHVVYNLLSNAIKFTEAGGKVVLHVTQTNRDNQPFLQVKVQDSGGGIPAGQLKNIFNRFFQVNNSNTLRSEGTGIGLALTKELVELMGGSIDVESTLGKGSTFNLLLPIGLVANTATSPSSHTFAPEPLPHLPSHQQAAVYATPESSDGEKPVLLLIEDNADVVVYLTGLLGTDYEVHTAPNGLLGIERALDLIPDLIVSDVMMPEKDGYEVCETLKKDERTSHVPIILLTARAVEADRITGLRMGADAYLMKPFNKEELFVRLENLLELRRELQQRYAGDGFPKSEKPEKQAAEPTIEDRFLQKLKTVVLENLDNSEFDTEKLSQAVHLSPSQLYRKLKALTDDTPHSFIQKIRLHQAYDMLTSTDKLIADIAYSVGFNDPNYFSRAFSKEFGESPSFYRK